MTAGRMHQDEVESDAALVARLLAAQFPQWATLPIVPLRSAGTDNRIYRLGNEMALRLPRVYGAALRLTNEQRWLSTLAPHLPLPIPVPLAQGTPGAGFPFPWSIYPWLDGENATLERLDDPQQAALELADFITSLRRIDTRGGPKPGPHNSSRGTVLAVRDSQTRAALASLAGTIDTSAAADVWDEALRAPDEYGPPVWLHGDLQSGNLLAVGGCISAVIDFGCLGIGDPACDLQVAWNLFPPGARDLFRDALQVDDATWARGRGWALSVALIALPYYQDTNPALAAISRYTIGEVLEER